MKKIFLPGIIGLITASGSAFAYDYTYSKDEVQSNEFQSIYVGANMGISGGDAGDYCDQEDLSCLSWKAYAGYRLNKNFAFEAGYHNFIEDRGSINQTPVKVTGLSAAVVGIMPADEIDMFKEHEGLEFFGKLGMAAWSSKTNYSVQTDGTDFMLGGGAQMKLGDNLGIRGEMEYLGSDIDSITYSAGLSYATF
uniref:Outer membrane protein beta-barrel domain-containing protein n=1 Tax=uncultured Thiotrichaceae bacterium TaxID=298394 RepID=A0A6S6U4N7_9GAMM|nr:MAG: Unknown protein [uncultured Thiotrichaceae bacterium]